MKKSQKLKKLHKEKVKKRLEEKNKREKEKKEDLLKYTVDFKYGE